MEQEVFVPVSAERLRAALADPAQVARAVPGLQQDAGTPPIAGRLKIRVGSHTITYRGTAQVSPAADGTYTLRADAAEARGTGKVHLTLTLTVTPTGTATGATTGTTLRFTGTARVDGRIAELPAETVTAAVARLLSRFGGNLGGAGLGAEPGAGSEELSSAGEPELDGAQSPQARRDAERQRGANAGRGSGDEQGADVGRGDEVEQSGEGEWGGEAEEDGEAGQGPDLQQASDHRQTPDPQQGRDPKQTPDAKPAPESDSTPERKPEHPFPPTIFETDIPSSALDPLDPPAEAAHARRTMIGRSAEEVDHAPPRGRYAPVPAPQTFTPANTLRWAAPAAALAVVSAVVVGRVLRRRR